MIDEDQEGSISTLPIAWGHLGNIIAEQRAEAALKQMAEHLHRLEGETGRIVHLNIEPEPGCVIGHSKGVVNWFLDHLLPRSHEERVRRYLRVCHDICHAAVMFEDQAEVLARYRAAGIAIGKVQLSNAPRAALRAMDDRDRTAALREIREFAETRYLHQTTIARDSRSLHFFDDLPEALRQCGEAASAGDEWRVHFHVPVYLETIGTLGTTRDHIEHFLRKLRPDDGIKHFEVETYAWDVLPEPWKVDELADGIAQELQWVIDTFRRVDPAAMEPVA